MAVVYEKRKYTKVDGTVSEHQVLRMRKTPKPQLAKHCANCTGFGNDCLSSNRCIECRADLRDGYGKTGYKARKGLQSDRAGLGNGKELT